MAPGACDWMSDHTLTLCELLVDPDGSPLPALCLLVVRFNGDIVPFPGEGFGLQMGDQCLIWGDSRAEVRLNWILGRRDVLADAQQRAMAIRTVSGTA